MQSAWYYEHLAGIRNAPNSLAFQNITFAPGVVCSNLSNVAATIVSHKGLIASSYQCGIGACSYVPENTNLTISCSAGTITGITFASFGTPSGDCDTG